MTTNTADLGLGFDLDALVDEVVATGIDQSQAKKGPELPAEGMAFLRIFAFLELGKQKYVPKKGMAEKEGLRVKIGVELSGAKWPARQTDEGLKPQTMWLKELTYSQDDRSGWFKLFKQLRGNRTDVRHAIQLLGNRAAFMGEIKHTEDKKYANIVMESITPAVDKRFDATLGENVYTPIQVQELRTPLKVFIWANATPAMFDALYIPGQLEAKLDDDGKVLKPARSRNVYQEKIRGALNLETSPIAAYIQGKISEAAQHDLDEESEPDELPPQVREPAGASDEADPMAGIG
ncbi:hypothetical protein RCIP0075_00037 [Klebsiella phage RCIP0075]